MTPDELLKAMFQAAVDAALPSLCVPAHLPPRPKGRTVDHRRRQGVRRHGQGARGCLGRAARRPGRDPLRLSRADRRGSKWSRPPTRCPTPPAARRRERILELVQGLTEDDLVLCLISGGGSALLALPAEGLTPRGQAGGEQGAAQVRRDHLRDEHGAEASLGHQGRQARRRRLPGQGGGADDLRRAGRRSLDHRLGSDRARPLDQRGRARHHREIRHRRAGEPCSSGCAPPTRRRSPAIQRLAARREHHDRHAAGLARSRRRGRAQGRRDAGHPRRLDRRRVARRGAGPCRHRAAMRHARPAGDAAMRADLGRRDHHHAEGQRQRRPQHRVPAGARHRARRHEGHLRACRRHRRHRRLARTMPAP